MVKKGAVIRNSIIMADTVIGENSVIEYSIIDENTVVGNNVRVGELKDSKRGITVLARDIKIDDGVTIPGGVKVDKNVSKEEE